MKPEEARKWAELYSAIADGKTWQIENWDPAASGRRWRDANEQDDPRGWRVDHLRIKPEPQSAAQAQIDAAQEELRLCKQDAIKLQDECIADTPPKQSTELPEASPETKGICNTERACAACYSGQGDCEVTV